MPTKHRVAVYARVSTRDQSCEMQLHALRQMAEQRGWIVVGEYVDIVSGAKNRRPELDKLNKAVNRGRIDVVAVWRFDRFARSVRHLVMALDEFRARGVDFVSMEDGIDTSTPTGRFTFHVIAAVAELEREIIRERTRTGLAAAKRRGARVGRPKAKVDPDDVAALRAEGKTVREIAKALGVGIGTVHRLLAAVPKPSPDPAP